MKTTDIDRGATIYDLGVATRQSALNENEVDNAMKVEDLNTFEDNKGGTNHGATIYDLGVVTKQSAPNKVEEDNAMKVEKLEIVEDNKGGTNQEVKSVNAK